MDGSKIDVRSNDLRLCELEIAILQTILKERARSVEEVYDHISVQSHLDYLAVLRLVHRLLRKGLLYQVRIGSTSLYQLTRQGMALRQYIL